MSDDRAGLAGDARVDLGQLGAGRQQRGLVVASWSGTSRRRRRRRRPAGRRAGRAPTAGPTGRAAAASCAPGGSTTIGPGWVSRRRRRRARRGRPARTGRATGRCGRRASTTGRWRCGGGRGGRRAAPAARAARCRRAEGPQQRLGRRRRGGPRRRQRAAVGEAAGDAPSGRPNAACWPGWGWGAAPAAGASRSGTSSNGPVWPDGPGEGRVGEALRRPAAGRGFWPSDVALRGSRPGR